MPFKCVGIQHSVYSTGHTCSRTNGLYQCDTHQAAGGLPAATHVGCTIKMYSRGFYQHHFPAQITCRHSNNATFATNTTVWKSSNGTSWVADPSSSVALSTNERFVVKIGNISPGLTIVPNSLESTYKQVVSANAGNCGFGGCNGPLTHREGAKSFKPRSIDVDVKFAGASGFCAGYHSPLMVFFEGERLPKFTGESHFKMGRPGVGYSWPEKGSQGWLLAQDSRGDGSVVEESQLFGNNDPGSNGFEALALHDENHDGVIDEKDPIFDRLILWNDKNGDSKSQKSEIRSARQAGIVSIGLQFTNSGEMDLGERAKAKQKGSFTYRNKKDGQMKQGIIFDIWFAELN